MATVSFLCGLSPKVNLKSRNALLRSPGLSFLSTSSKHTARPRSCSQQSTRSPLPDSLQLASLRACAPVSLLERCPRKACLIPFPEGAQNPQRRQITAGPETVVQTFEATTIKLQEPNQGRLSNFPELLWTKPGWGDGRHVAEGAGALAAAGMLAAPAIS